MLFDDYPIRDMELPPLLTEIPDKPKKLFIRGTFPDPHSHIFLSVVGSREYTSYGKQVCETLIEGLRGYPIVIVSGLALGMDGIAHRSALRANLKTIAVPGSGLHESVLYPGTHKNLAKDILDNGGALISEFSEYERARLFFFPKRNRLMAGLSHAVLVIEAELRSGTLITSRLATEYNRDVFTVPASIFSPTAKGPHMLLSKGAFLVQSSEDICKAFSLDTTKVTVDLTNLTEDERRVYDALKTPLPRNVLIKQIGTDTSKMNILLSSLEIKGYITEELGCVRWV